MTGPADRRARAATWLPAAVAVIVVLISAAPRLAVAAGALPEPARPFIWSDLLESYDQLLAGGRVPYWQTVFYYPPLVGYLAGVFAVVTTDAFGYLAAWTLLVAAVAAGVAVALTCTVGPLRALAFWSAAPQLLFYAGMNFDVLPTAAVLAAVLLMRMRRSGAAFSALAIGTLAKAFPAAAVPVLLDGLRGERRRLFAAGVTFGAVALVVALPSVLAPWPSTAFAGDYAALTNFDSLWGIARAAWGDASAIVLVPVTTLGLIATYALGVLPTARRRGAEPAVAAGLALVTLLLWARLYSPQYSIWLLPFFALVAIPRRWYALLAVADVAIFMTVYPLSLRRWESEPDLHAVLVTVLAAGIVLRHVALLGTWLSMRHAPIVGTRAPAGPASPAA